MAMTNTILCNGYQRHYPYWVNVPPNVPKYPSSQEMFRRDSPDKFTTQKGRESYQDWMDKWHDYRDPVRRQEELPKLTDRREPCSRPWQYRPGTSAVDKWTKEGKDWPVSQQYLTSGRPVSETMRARSSNRVSPKEHNFYPYSNYMTSTYRKPVYSVHGPIQKEHVFGLTRQHNRHGYMPFEDYY